MAFTSFGTTSFSTRKAIETAAWAAIVMAVGSSSERAGEREVVTVGEDRRDEAVSQGDRDVLDVVHRDGQRVTAEGLFITYTEAVDRGTIVPNALHIA